MAKKIYFPALQSDLLLYYKKLSGRISYGWIWGISIIVLNWFDFPVIMGILWSLGFFSLIRYIVKYARLKQLEKEGRVLFIEKRKNERIRNIIYMFICFVFALIFNSGDMMPFLLGFLSFIYLIKYFLYIPSTVFIANDYELVITRKRKRKYFDFSYPNRLRFVYNMISFDHPINGKDSWKDINMDRGKMNEIRLFLSKNYGKEMVLNPTTGLPYTI